MSGGGGRDVILGQILGAENRDSFSGESPASEPAGDRKSGGGRDFGKAARQRENVSREVSTETGQETMVVAEPELEVGQVTQVALKGNFRDFIKTNPSPRQIEAWIRTHRAE